LDRGRTTIPPPTADLDYWKRPDSVLRPGCAAEMTANSRAILKLIIEN